MASALNPIAEALYAVFQDPALQALVGGRVETDVPQDPAYPFLWIEVQEPQQFGGFGTKPGLGTLPEIDIRLHAYGTFHGQAELAAILSTAILLIADPPVVEGYQSCGIFHDTTLWFPDEELRGMKVKELVSSHRLYVEES